MPLSVDTLSFDRISALAREWSESVVWEGAQRIWRWDQLGRELSRAAARFREAEVAPGAVVLIPGESRAESLVWLLAAAAAGAVAAPLRAGRFGEVGTWLEHVRIDWRVDDGQLRRFGNGRMRPAAESLLGLLAARGHPGLILATGGTTGKPKLVLHDLARLLATVPVRPAPTRRVLPLMNFDHIGGLDMAWRALASRQILVEPPTEFSPASVAALIETRAVEVMPATPSFLNLLLLAEVHRSRKLGSLQVVPYGAEPMPTGLLARLRAAFPGVAFVQRFGTSETGAVPVCSADDGLALRGTDHGFAWKIHEGELWVQSPARALGYLTGESGGFEADGWYRTGDLAEKTPGGGVRILGRRQELINVGGEKVLPGPIEASLLSHPEVADCRVWGLPSVLLGQVVAAEVVWRGGSRDPIEVKNALRRFVGATLPQSHLPAVVKLVEAIETTGNFKKRRISIT